MPESAEALTRRALDGGWGIDGVEGIPYTVDWDGTPVASVRLHWPVCEAIQASAELIRTTGDEHWEQWYSRLWDHAAAVWIDENGAWRNEVDAKLHEAGVGLARTPRCLPRRRCAAQPAHSGQSTIGLMR